MQRQYLVSTWDDTLELAAFVKGEGFHSYYRIDPGAIFAWGERPEQPDFREHRWEIVQ